MFTSDVSQVERVGSESPRPHRIIRPWFYALVIPAVLVVAVITLALQDGTNGAVVTAFVVVATAGTAVGLWGTAMAVRDTHDFGPRPEPEVSGMVSVRDSPSPGDAAI